MKLLSVTTEMKATEQYFPVVLFIMLYKVVLTFESVDEILNCGHSNESYWAVLSRGTIYYAVQGDSNFWVQTKWNPLVWPIKWKLFGSSFTWYYFFFNSLQNETWIICLILTLATSCSEIF